VKVKNSDKHHRDQHAQRGARGVFGQVRGIERDRLVLQLHKRLEEMPARFGEKCQQSEDQKDRNNIPAAENPRPAADRNWHDQPHTGHVR
jgi:hypothetical protein